MFEDIDDQKPEPGAAKQAIVITRESADRAIVYAIWTRNAGGAMPVEAAWALLDERYPDEARFLLLHTYEELQAPHTSETWSPSAFLAKVRLAAAVDDLHPLTEDDAARLERLRARVSSRAGDPTAAKKRLARLAADTVRELHDRTSGGKPIGRTSATVPTNAAGDEWRTALAAAKGKKTTYTATAKVTAGDVVEHPKFGAGVVLGVEPGRANILFETGARKLVAG
jgi:hypothetical protein